MAELGLIGKAPGKYNIYFGGNATSTRLNVIHRENMPLTEFVETVKPVLQRWTRERVGSERLGDFYHRVFVPELEAARVAAPTAD
jgi:sulfite reductase (NADPH) hemoprotein beta-component